MRVSSSSASDVGDRLFRIDQLVLQVRDGVGQQPRRIPLGVQAHVLGDHHQQAAGVVGVVDREVGVQAGQQRGLVAQDPHAHGVERGHPHRPGARADQADDPLAHLGGGLVGERDGQDLAGADVAGGEQVGDPAGEHGGLARPGAGDDQQRRTLVQHRLALLRVEPVKQLVGLGWIGQCTVMSVPTYRCVRRHSLRRHGPRWHTQHVLIKQRRFFYGYRPAVPVVSCFPEPRGPLPDPGLVSCVRPEKE